MARVTVEDCVVKIPNRFDLVMVAAQRARDIAAGGGLTIDRDNDKNPVVALREIADETIDLAAMQESLIKGMQKHVEVDEPEEDQLDQMLGELGVAEGEPAVAGGEEGEPSADDFEGLVAEFEDVDDAELRGES